jgi:hypothetical protein
MRKGIAGTAPRAGAIDIGKKFVQAQTLRCFIDGPPAIAHL